MQALLGVLLALAASTLYAVSISLQAGEARATGSEHGLRLGLARSLLARRRWLAGAALGVAGWPLQALALLVAPLVVVQPVLAFGLAVLLAIAARTLGEHATRRDWAAVAVIVVAVGGLVAAAPARTSVRTGLGALGPVIAVLALIAVAPLVARGAFRAHGRAIALASGAGFAVVSLATKLLADAFSAGAWVTTLGWLVVVGGGSAIAVLTEMSAYQLARATAAAPIVFVTEIAVPALVVSLLSPERPHTIVHALVLTTALVALIGATVVLASSPAIAERIAVAAREDG